MEELAKPEKTFNTLEDIADLIVHTINHNSSIQRTNLESRVKDFTFSVDTSDIELGVDDIKKGLSLVVHQLELTRTSIVLINKQNMDILKKLKEKPKVPTVKTNTTELRIFNIPIYKKVCES